MRSRDAVVPPLITGEIYTVFVRLLHLLDSWESVFSLATASNLNSIIQMLFMAMVTMVTE